MDFTDTTARDRDQAAHQTADRAADRAGRTAGGRYRLQRRSIAVAILIGASTACSSGSDGSPASSTAQQTTAGANSTDLAATTIPTGGSTTNPPTATTAPTSTIALIDGPDTVEFDLAGGRGQATLTGAEPGEVVQLVSDDVAVAQADADAQGSIVFRGLDRIDLPDPAVHAQSSRGASEEVKIVAIDATPEPAFYAEQRLPTGNSNGDRLGYITTFDGTTLSASVWLPGPAEDGPYPTVVEYSGYAPSDPNSVGFPQLFTGLGYAYVGVNMRGTGCSGGSFQYFEYQQSMDGYDVIETVGAQPWVLDQRVGMVGISYPGISQLFVAQTQPPSLAAITPLSVIADSYESTLYPGGVLNTGFAVDWLTERVAEAQPEGQEWASAQIAAGDETCAANQQIRLQAPDQVSLIDENPYWTEAEYGGLAPRLFVDKIDVPTFVAGAWQDEQTGGDFANMLSSFSGSDRFYATLTNGLHTESIGPGVFPRMVEFLDLYVAQRTPTLDGARAVAPLIGGAIFGTSEIVLPDTDRFAGMDYAAALAAFEAEPPIEVLFEEGAADGRSPRVPLPRFSARFDQFPITDATDTTWYLNGDGGAAGLLATEPGADATTTYTARPDATPDTFLADGSNIWSVDVAYDWQQGAADTYAAWLSAPLAADTTVLGTSSVDLWLSADTDDTDLEVTISEVRPDGQEVYVQSGWLRASHRMLDEQRSTATHPVPTNRAADAEPLPAGEAVLVRVPTLPFGHVFRAGSQIRLSVDAPGGNRGEWVFDTISDGERVEIVSDAEHRSAIVMPVVDLAAHGVDIPAEYPPCDALRGQPCRPFAIP